MDTHCIICETFSVYVLVSSLCISGLFAGGLATGVLVVTALNQPALFLDPTIPSVLISFAFIQLAFCFSVIVIIRAFLLGKIFAYRFHFGLLLVEVLINLFAALLLLHLSGTVKLPAVGDIVDSALFEYAVHVFNLCCAVIGFGESVPECSTAENATLCLQDEYKLGSWVAGETCTMITEITPNLLGNFSLLPGACGGGEFVTFFQDFRVATEAAVFAPAVAISTLAGLTSLVFVLSMLIHCCAKVDEAQERRDKKARTSSALSQLRMDQELGRRWSANAAAKLPPPPGLPLPKKLKARTQTQSETEVQKPPPFQATVPVSTANAAPGRADARAPIKPEVLGSGAVPPVPGAEETESRRKTLKPERYGAAPAPFPIQDTGTSRRRSTFRPERYSDSQLISQNVPSEDMHQSESQRKGEEKSQDSEGKRLSPPTSFPASDVTSSKKKSTPRPVWFLEDDDY